MRDKPVPASAPMGFFSDVHGNLRALEAVLDELARRGVGDIYVAGDLLLGGDEPAEVFKRLSQVGAKCVRGLGDAALSQIAPTSLKPLDEEQRAMADRFMKTRTAIGDLALKFLSRLPERRRIPMIDGTEIVVVHGSPADPTVEITHDLEDDEMRVLCADDPADIVVCGASHVPFVRVLEDRKVVNVGSVGAAPEGNIAHYTVITPRMEGTIIEQDCVEY
jgi:predicted phosphodiesterase